MRRLWILLAVGLLACAKDDAPNHYTSEPETVSQTKGGSQGAEASRPVNQPAPVEAPPPPPGAPTQAMAKPVVAEPAPEPMVVKPKPAKARYVELLADDDSETDDAPAEVEEEVEKELRPVDAIDGTIAGVDLPAGAHTLVLDARGRGEEDRGLFATGKDRNGRDALGWSDEANAPAAQRSSRVASRSRVVPHVRDGERAGFKVLGVREDSKLYRLGFRSGDAVLAIDGKLATSDQALNGLHATNGVFEVERGGKRVVLYPDFGEGERGPEVRPTSFLPRMCYFENTYLGRSPAYLEELRQLDAAYPSERPYAESALPEQALDAPSDAGLALTATLDRPYVDQPGRVMLQIGLQGSRRFGWRRPPLDFVLVVDADVAGGAPETLTRAVTGLLRRLGPQDRLGVVVVDPAGARVLTEVVGLREARTRLTRALVDFQGASTSQPADLGAALLAAGGTLRHAAEGSARVPGSQAIVLLTQGGGAGHVAAARAAAHQLTVQGATTSVIALGGQGAWWQVANAGHGNDHRGRDLDAALDAELASLSKVIARLLRINIKLAPGVEAIRVLGSRVLKQAEVKRVKAREEATDRNLSRTMGVKADRGDDDDGVQTVIPYFHGGDAHVILVELWVDKPGAVAEVTLKYKDMVKLSNATARAGASLGGLPRPLTAANRAVQRNVQGFMLAENLAATAAQLHEGHQPAIAVLNGARPVTPADQAMISGFQRLLRRPGSPQLAQALRLASRRRVSHAVAQ